MNVEIKAIANLESESAKSGLTAQLYREDENAKIEFLDSITVPIQGRNDIPGEMLEIDAGKYLLQILLPDGQTLTKDFEVTPVRKKEEVIIELPHEGPHEWTTLHAMAGNFRREAQLTKGFTRALSDNPQWYYKRLSINFSKGFELSFLRPDENRGGGILYAANTIDIMSNLIRQDLDVEGAALLFGTDLKIEEPTREDNDFAIFKVSYSGVVYEPGPVRSPFRFHPGHPFLRQYLMQKSALGGTLVSLPAPWVLPQKNIEAEIELLVKKSGNAESAEFAMTINEPMINTVLGYINVGAIHQAAQLISTEYAIEMLYQKIENPFAAAVGAYLLIFGNTPESKTRAKNEWKDWVNNLDNWFPWFPDGAALNAARHFWLRDYLREDRKSFEDSYSNGLQALNRAYARGLPFFTFGLKLMIDGFRYFANEGEEQAKKRLDVLENLAGRTDPSQPFLTINFSRRW